MVVINQDKDDLFELSTKDIFFKRHFVFCSFRIIFMGWNLYGRTNEGRVLLGTFDSKNSCKTTMAEMQQHERAGAMAYIIPDESDGIEDFVAGGATDA